MNAKTKLGLITGLASTALLAYCLPQAGIIQAMEESSGSQAVASTKQSTAETESSTSEEAETSATSETKESSSTTDSKSSSSTSTSNSTTSSSKPTTSSSTSSSSSSSSQSKKETTSSSSTVTLTKKEKEQLKENLPTTVDEEEVEENYQYSVVKNQTTAEFIAAIGEDAQAIAWKNDLYASVMIAQAILETGSGNSALSSAPNYNLFGIKGSYEGSSVSFSTQEDDGSGSLYTIQSKFRKYPSYKESLEDYATLLTGGISGNGSFYSRTWKSNTDTYKDATAFLTGRYATDVYYGQKLNALIEAYNLTEFDNETSSSTSAKKTTTDEEGVSASKDGAESNVVSQSNEDELYTPGKVVPEKAFQTPVPEAKQSATTQQPANQLSGKQLVK